MKGQWLLVAEHRKRFRQLDSVRFLTLLTQLPIVVEEGGAVKSIGELLALGKANNLSSNDASYLELAMRQGVPLATLDQQLIEAAHRLSVPLLEV